MRFALSLIVLCSIIVLYVESYPNDDVAQALSNERIFQNYINCVLEKGKCTPQGEKLKGSIKFVLQDECAKCTEEQKTIARVVITILTQNKLDEWKAINDKYDPGGKYRENYEELLKKLE